MKLSNKDLDDIIEYKKYDHNLSLLVTGIKSDVMEQLKIN
jgi:hypothetical protein